MLIVMAMIFCTLLIIFCLGGKRAFMDLVGFVALTFILIVIIAHVNGY